MPSNFKIYYLLLFFLLGCESDFNFDLPFEEKLVLNTEMDTNSKIKVYLSTNRPPVNNNEYRNIADAEIYVLENITTKILLSYVPKDNSISELGHYEANIKPKADFQYTFVAKHKDFDSITVTEKIPSEIKLQEYSIVSHPLYASQNVPAKVNLKFIDPVGKNYYFLDIWYKIEYDTLDIATNTYLPVQNYIWGRNEFIQGINFTQNYWGNNMFDDATFENMATTLEVEILNPVRPKKNQKCTMYIDFRNVSEAYFLYQKTFAENQENIYDAFRDPIFVYNNINGGYGIAMSWVQDFKNIIIQP
jgi:hypothetical protein